MNVSDSVKARSHVSVLLWALKDIDPEARVRLDTISNPSKTLRFESKFTQN